MALSDNLRSRIFSSPSVLGNNAASTVTWLNAAAYILPDLIAIADSATSGTGDIKSDGSVDFIANETWDAGGPDTTVVGVLGVTVSDGIATTLLDKSQLRIDDGADFLLVNKLGVTITDGSSSTSISKEGVLVDSGAVGTPSMAFYQSPTMGFYRVSGTQMGVAVSGTLVGGFDASGLFTGTISEQVATVGVTIDGVLCKDSNVRTGAGLITEVAYGTAGDPNTGIYFPAHDELSVAMGGVDYVIIKTGYVNISAPLLAVTEINLNNDINQSTAGSLMFDVGNNQFEFLCNAEQINILPNTGWVLPTGSALKVGFDADASTTASAAYVPAEVQAINNQLVEVQQTVKAMMDHLMTNMGLFVA